MILHLVNCVGARNFCDSASSQHHNSGGGGGGGSLKKKIKTSISQLRDLATHTSIGGGGGVSLKAPWSYVCHKLGSE